MRVLLLVCAWWFISRPAEAVVPQLFGPLQALLSVMPQILLFLLAGATALLKFQTWKRWTIRLYHGASDHRWLTLIVCIALVGGITLALQLGGASTSSQPDAPQDIIDWAAFRGNMARTGHLDDLPGPRTAQILWSFDALSNVADFSSSPAVIGNRLFIGCAEASIFSSGGRVYCLDTTTGNLIWDYETPRPIFSSPVVADGKVYIGEGLHTDMDAHLYCLAAADGTFLWSLPTNSHVESSPCVVDGKLFVGAGDDGIYAIDADTGDTIWQHVTQNFHVDASPAVWKDRVYIGTGYDEPAIYCLDAENGEEIWSQPVELSAWGTPAIWKGFLYIGLGNGNYIEPAETPHGQVICLDAETGKIQWKRDMDATVLASVAVQDGVVYAGARDGSLFALRASDGEILWQSELDASIFSAPAVDKTLCYAITRSGRLHAVALDSGNTLWSFDMQGERVLSSPAIASGNLYVGLDQGKVMAVGER